MKYKVGDKVRVRDDLVVDKVYFMEDREIHNIFANGMKKYRGNVYKISKVTKSNGYMLEYCGVWKFTDEMLEPACKFKIGDVVIGNDKADKEYFVTKKGYIGKVTDNDGKNICLDNMYWVDPECFDICIDKIVITTDGKTTTAKMYNGKDGVETAIARCSPDDEFDFATGAKIALDRLFEEKLYNGKIVCTKVKPCYAFTVGKIYEVKDGKLTIDNGSIIPCEPAKNIDDLKKALCCKFIEVVE